ncbi:MAG: hypothetical protein V4614_14925 [Pseudomonadota bacterium]
MDSAIASPRDDYEPWRARDDMRTLLDAQKIQKDPKRMKNARRAAKEQLIENKAMETLANGK